MPDVRSFTTADASPEILTALRGLLDETFGDFADDDWEHALGGWHVVVADGEALLAHAAVVPRDLDVGGRRFHAGYVEGVATTPQRHRAGLGSLAMAEIAELLRRHFELGALSTGRHSFYERLGWERWRGSTFARRGSELVRTEEDDDTVMVLCFEASADIDLSAPLTCEGRPGDDW